jgi:hypothetical protein
MLVIRKRRYPMPFNSDKRFASKQQLQVHAGLRINESSAHTASLLVNISPVDYFND